MPPFSLKIPVNNKHLPPILRLIKFAAWFNVPYSHCFEFTKTKSKKQHILCFSLRIGVISCQLNAVFLHQAPFNRSEINTRL